MLAPGSTFGRFHVIALAGSGGMGSVYKATDTTVGGWVALKAMQGDASGTDLARFEREAKVLASFRHPNVVTMLGFEIIEGLPIIVMEWVEGYSLLAVTQGKVRASMPHRARWMREAALALAALHERGVIHRDLKPANMMVESSTGVLKLVDFGIARVTTPAPSEPKITGTLDVIGTPRYMAPEQRQGTRLVDARADQYAWGAVAFELVTSSAGDASDDTDIHGRLTPTIARALRTTREERFPTMRHLLASLDDVERDDAAQITRTLDSRVASPPRPTRFPSSSERPAKPEPTRKNVAVFIVSFALVVALGLGGLAAVTLRRAQPRLTSPPLPTSSEPSPTHDPRRRAPRRRAPRRRARRRRARRAI